MPTPLIVGGVPIPVSPGGIKRDRLDGVDRARAFDQTYRASTTGTAKKDYFFTTPPIPRQQADLIEQTLGIVTPQVCSGDIIGGSSNLALWSQDLTNGVWGLTDVTIGSNLAGAPDGTMTGDKIQEMATTNIHRAAQAITTASVQQTFSTWVRQGERTAAVISMSDAATGDASIGIDLTNGSTFASGLAVGNWTGISSEVSATDDYTNFWYRVKLTATRGAGTQTYISIWVYSGATSYTGVAGNGIYNWGNQLALGSDAYSYVPTTTAAVNTLATNCHSEITGWTPVRTATGHAVVIDFALHEA